MSHRPRSPAREAPADATRDNPALRIEVHALASFGMLPWLLALLFLLALAALATIIRAVLRTTRNSHLCTAPLRHHQEIEFPAPGPVVLCLQGPRFTPQFRKLMFELRPVGGEVLRGHRILFRTITSGVSQARVTLRSFDLPMAGRYRLCIHGLEPQYVDAPEHSIVFMRPHLMQTILSAVGITLAAGLAIVSLVFFLLAVIPTASAIDPGRVTGHVSAGDTRIELRQAYAHLHHARGDRAPQLRVVLADREIPQESLAGPDVQAVLALARTGELRGLLLELDPDDPDTLTLIVLLPQPPDGAFTALRGREAPGPILRNLGVAPQRVGGDLSCPPSPTLDCSAHFSAPLFAD